LWTSHRYSERVVDAMESALFELAKGQKNTEKTLIGFSGGGVIAALLAARSATPSRLITIAANLNHEHWTEHFGHSPLNGSLNPVDFASELRRVPQVHLLGAEDERVPLDTISSYTKALGDTGRWEVRVVPGFDHRCCWWEAWPTLIRDLTAKLNSS
ncbi:MAG: alpha/beta hydrolase, partial [Gammaproteobacteria bacterium]